jgi:hypothetical protein
MLFSGKLQSGRFRAANRESEMRTLTSYGIACAIVLAILNGVAWRAGAPWLYGLNVFSIGFVMGLLGMYIAAWLYGYRQVC